MSLQLRSLRHLIALSRRLNYARAAEDIGISQSALSRSIQSLEVQLGMKLFDRDRAGVSLTPQGQMVVEQANVLLASADDLERQFILNARGEGGRIRFGMAPMPARALLAPVLADRFRVAPDVINEVVVRDVGALWSLLVAGDIEFFVYQEGLSPDSTQARVETLGRFPLSLFVRNGHPLLDGECHDRLFPVVRSSWAGLPLPPELEGHIQNASNVVEDLGALAALTSATDAIWFSSAYAVTEELKSGQLRELPRPKSAAPIEVRMAMYTLARQSQSPLAKAFKQAFRHCITLLGENRNKGAVSPIATHL